MPKVEIESEQLAGLANLLGQAAGLLQGLIPTEKSLPKEAKKRGRPPKKAPLRESRVEPSSTVKQSYEKEFVGESDVKEILDEPVQPREPFQGERIIPVSKFMGIAKKANWQPPEGEKVYGRKEDISKRKSDIKFIDIKSVPPDVPRGVPRDDPKYYPPREDDMPRPEARKMKFTCTKCHQPFEAFPSEVPAAFARFSAPGTDLKDDKSFSGVECNRCSVK